MCATFVVLALAGTTPLRAETTLTGHASEPAYADAIRSVNPSVRLGQSRAFAHVLLASSHRLGVDPNLVMAVVTVESHWNQRAVSSSGARGLGQFLPGTARDLGIDPASARSSLSGVSNYLHRLLGLFKTSRTAMREAIASYNAGPYAVRRFGIPRHGETPRYVVKVLASWNAFRSQLRAEPRVARVAFVIDPVTNTEAVEQQYWGAR